MNRRFTREHQYAPLTATATAQPLTLDSQFRKTIIDVTGAGAIRVRINGVGDLDGDNGILVSFEKPLTLYNHIVHTFEYIRETSMTGDVAFQVIGLWADAHNS